MTSSGNSQRKRTTNSKMRDMTDTNMIVAESCNLGSDTSKASVDRRLQFWSDLLARAPWLARVSGFFRRKTSLLRLCRLRLPAWLRHTSGDYSAAQLGLGSRFHQNHTSIPHNQPTKDHKSSALAAFVSLSLLGTQSIRNSSNYNTSVLTQRSSSVSTTACFSS